MSDTETQGNFSLIKGYVPGLVGRVGELHGRYYASVWDSGAPFEMLVLRQLCDFIEHYDPAVDLVVSARVDDVLAGAISIVGRPHLYDCGHGPDAGVPAGDATPGDAPAVQAPDVQLRFFIVDPAFHGQGMGKALLHAALGWCRERGVRSVFLWTVDNLPQSRGLYESVGFRVVERVPDDRYTLLRDNLRLELRL